MINQACLRSRGAFLAPIHHVGFRAVLFFLLLTLPLHSLAISVHYNRITFLEYLMREDMEVLRVKVVEGKLHQTEYDGMLHECGLSYTAEVLEPVHNTKESTGSLIQFESYKPFYLDRQYVVLLRRYEIDRLDPSLIVSPFPVKKPGGFRASKEFSDCRKKIPLSHARVRFQFRRPRHNDPIKEQLLIQETFVTPFVPDEVEVRKIGCGEESDIPCKHFSDYSYIVWSSLRRYLENWQPKHKRRTKGRALHQKNGKPVKDEQIDR